MKSHTLRSTFGIISIPSPPHANKRMTVTQQMYTFLIAYLIICVSIWMCVCVCVCVCVCLCVCVCMCVSPYRPFTFPHRCAHMCPWQRFLPPTKQPITWHHKVHVLSPFFLVCPCVMKVVPIRPLCVLLHSRFLNNSVIVRCGCTRWFLYDTCITLFWKQKIINWEIEGSLKAISFSKGFNIWAWCT